MMFFTKIKIKLKKNKKTVMAAREKPLHLNYCKGTLMTIVKENNHFLCFIQFVAMINVVKFFTAFFVQFCPIVYILCEQLFIIKKNYHSFLKTGLLYIYIYKKNFYH